MHYTLLNFNEFRDACHNASYNAGWWRTEMGYTNDRGERHVVTVPNSYIIPAKICLIHSEISEMNEGYLSGALDEHLPHLPNAAVEGGDTLIRIGDTAGYLEIDMTSAIALVDQIDHIEFDRRNNLRLTYDGKVYLGPDAWFALLHRFASGAMEGFRKNASDKIIPGLPALNANLARIVILIDMLAQMNDWDMPAVAEAKMDYNSIRPDHKLEARAIIDGGKAF